MSMSKFTVITTTPRIDPDAIPDSVYHEAFRIFDSRIREILSTKEGRKEYAEWKKARRREAEAAAK